MVLAIMRGMLVATSWKGADFIAAYIQKWTD